MDHLVSCYFCGNAVDAQLEEYPLVTADSVETGTSVVLCPSCRRKLTAVVEEVLDAAIESPDLPSVDLDSDPLEGLEASATDATAATGVESVDSRDDESSDSTGDPVDGSGADDEEADENDDEVRVERNDDDDVRIEGNDDEIQVAETDDTETKRAETDSEDASETPARTDRETADSGDLGETGDDTGGQTEAAEDPFQRGEYNKVVRLLQNREFPVEIEEITVVARSAYGIDRDTTHAILNALIESDILEDRGDELVRT